MSGSFFGVMHLATYIAGAFVIVLLPGPNSLFVLSTAARRGVRAGYRAACGVFVGDAVLMLLTAAGAASALKAWPALFMALKYAGGAYLAYLGVKMLVGAWKGRLASPVEPDAAAVEARVGEGDPLRRALGISLVNPKAILFFIAFFIQFVDPGYAHKALSFAILGGIVQVLSFLYLTALIFSGARLAAAFRRWRRTRTALTGGAGALFLGFGVKLATASVN